MRTSTTRLRPGQRTWNDLLDNSIIRKYAHPDPDEAVLNYVSEHRTEPWGISAIVLFEFLSFYDTQANSACVEASCTRTRRNPRRLPLAIRCRGGQHGDIARSCRCSLDDVEPLKSGEWKQFHQATFDMAWIPRLAEAGYRHSSKTWKPYTFDQHIDVFRISIGPVFPVRYDIA